MNEVVATLAHLAQFGVVAGGLVVAGLLVWLVGLLVVLRDSKPGERPDIIRAYATCRPFTSDLHSSESRTGACKKTRR
jgi:hypothetical protein